MFRSIALISAIFFSSFSTAWADADEAAELFGKLPSFSDIQISPDGTKIALVQKLGTDAIYQIRNIETGELLLTRKIPKAYDVGVEFADNEHLFLRRSYYYVNRDREIWPRSNTRILNLNNLKTYDFLKDNRTVYKRRNTKSVIGPSTKDGHFLASAYGSGPSGGLTLNLYEVKYANGKGKLSKRRNSKAPRWFIAADGGSKLLVETHELENEYYSVSVLQNGQEHTFFESRKMREYSLNIRGFDEGAENVFFELFAGENGNLKIFKAPLNKQLESLDDAKLAFGRDDADIERVFSDFNNTVHGVQYSGFKPSFEFLDPEIDKWIAEVLLQFPTDSVHIRSWSDNFEKIVAFVEGPKNSGNFYLLDRTERTTTLMARQRKSLPDNRISPIEAIHYTARDGLSIPALLTRPQRSKDSEQSLPLVVMPHGGPEAYDAIGFNYWAQFLADQGYLVFQPNFRGSSGFGVKFRNAGHGEWGRKMQDDITDGVTHLIESGQADPDRICIVGGSYGGYAALAGGAYTPELYKCILSFAGVSDLAGMLEYERSEGSRKNNTTLAYWQKRIAHISQVEELFAASPTKQAENFQAPVLLIHGNFDWIVPLEQMTKMADALKRAEKDIESYTFNAGDHWLNHPDHRVGLLKMTGEFLKKHIGHAQSSPSEAQASP